MSKITIVKFLAVLLIPHYILSIGYYYLNDNDWQLISKEHYLMFCSIIATIQATIYSKFYYSNYKDLKMGSNFFIIFIFIFTFGTIFKTFDWSYSKLLIFFGVVGMIITGFINYKIKQRNLIFILLPLSVVFLSCNSSVDNSKHLYKFILKDSNFIDTNFIIRGFIDPEFTMQRTILQDSSYKDSSLICYDGIQDCVIRYKKESNGDWVILLNGKWNIFFDNKSKHLQKITIVNDTTFIFPITEKITEDDKVIPYNKRVLDKNTVIYPFRIKNIHLHEPEYNSVYWFEPTFGIIAIESPPDYIVREDFSNYLRNQMNNK